MSGVRKRTVCPKAPAPASADEIGMLPCLSESVPEIGMLPCACAYMGIARFPVATLCLPLAPLGPAPNELMEPMVSRIGVVSFGSTD